MSTKHEIDFLDEINSKYSNIENEIDIKLSKLQQEEIKYKKEDIVAENSYFPKHTCNSLQEAKCRNTEILKTLEMTKARLRSRSTFSPIEMILKKAKKNYEKEYALVQITTKNS
ncbi:uncharacterized protein LOC129609781 [Condylostylus longicornis]|uniref:uncharacterized protein LOC129609781 n=1 Tax=Condylostylus longicornis TaxID=2530218 RepID=UPI00244DDC26|nr:uncharacterized protein LOC129609781 [Condylostylus longicornis]